MDHSPRSVKDGVGLEPVSLTPTWSCCLSLPLPPMYLHLLFFNRSDVRSGESVKQDKLWDPLRKLKTILNSIILKGTWPQPQLPSRISGVVCLRPGAGILAL